MVPVTVEKLKVSAAIPVNGEAGPNSLVRQPQLLAKTRLSRAWAN